MRWMCILLAALFGVTANAQGLQAGFDRDEAAEMLKIMATFGDSAIFGTVPKPQDYNSLYRSGPVGLDNVWDLWKHKTDSVAVISVRGTTANDASWLANFYAAMIPAKGKLKISQAYTFEYNLADNPQAAVHVGWMVAMASLLPDISQKLDSMYNSGIKDYVIAGHSQGGAIAYLLTAHFRRLQHAGKLPSDIVFKTYCSAAPKPGNLFFAYAYEAMTPEGYEFNLVNSADWVPEVPLSVQTTDDFNTTNPFANAREKIKDKSFPERVALTKVYNGFDKPTREAQENLQKYLGEAASKSVARSLSGYEAPEYFPSNNYVRTGTNVVLLADSAYFREFPDDREKIFVHHFPKPYLYLLNRQFPEVKKDTVVYVNPVKKDSTIAEKPDRLSGKWRLVYISRPFDDFNAMYPSKKPLINIDAKSKKVSGFTGCNDFTGRISLKQNTIYFQSGMSVGSAVCDGLGELHFMETLKEVTKYTIADDGALLLQQGGTLLMRLKKI